MESKQMQDVINIVFEIGLTIHSQNDFFRTKNTEEVAKWIADQLNSLGYKTTPCGSLWGVLDE